ncbi:MAG: SDR family NAD(P)-dependent oxidoreductase, partial [Trebonia sp.]
MSRFDAVRVLITGAGSGIGRAVARRFAAEGARVACLDVKNAEQTVAEIGATAQPVQCDVSDAAAVEQAVASVVER